MKEQVESMGADFLELVFEEEAAGEGGYQRSGVGRGEGLTRLRVQRLELVTDARQAT